MVTWTCFTDMELQHGHELAAWTWHAVWTWTRRMGLDMPHGHGHSALTCSIDMDMQHEHWQAVRTWTCSIGKDRQHQHKCARHNFPYTRRWMQMVFDYQMIYFPETDNTIKHGSCYGCWYSNYYTMHNDTHSVHKRSLVLWRARPLCLEASRYVYPPPLSDANCPPFPPPGGPGPPAPKMVPISPGSTHTPSAPSVTIRMQHLKIKCKESWMICEMDFPTYIFHSINRQFKRHLTQFREISLSRNKTFLGDKVLPDFAKYEIWKFVTKITRNNLHTDRLS